MRINKCRLYLVETTPGISGFKRWGEVERRIVPGRFVRTRYTESEVLGMFRLGETVCCGDSTHGLVRVEDGRLPDFQPVVKVGAYVGNFAHSGYFEAVVIGPDPAFPTA